MLVLAIGTTQLTTFNYDLQTCVTNSVATLQIQVSQYATANHTHLHIFRVSYVGVW